MTKILITGATGMVGRNIVLHPAANDFDILAPSRKELNLFDSGSTNSYIKTHNPDVIIHCAGKVGGIQANIKNPYGFMYENMIMGLNLVNAAKEQGIERLINLGSSCMYPRNATNPLTEETILKGELEPTNEGYAIAKTAIAKLCVYAGTEDYKYKTLIPCNLYGYWDKFNPEASHMIPAIIHKTHQSKINGNTPIEVWGSGNARREFMFAEDLADFIYFSINKLDLISGMMNVGLGIDYSVREYYLAVKEVLNSKANLEFNLEKPEGMKQKVVDITKQQKLGWFPKTDLHTGIEKTYKHYMEHHK
jgi:GDP-L-fucose synthase